jgi:hypothetical protein
MLPGFRFLFAAVALSMSVLVFGLGAGALLRAAHEEFASTPAWRAPPETMFAQPNETTTPVLAMLRLDPPVVEQKPSDNDNISSVIPPAGAPGEPTAILSTPAEPETIAALKPEPPSSPEIANSETSNSETPKSETPKSEIPIAEVPAQGELTPVQADTPGDETRIAANETISPPPSEAAPTGSEPMNAPVSPDIAPAKPDASKKIATLGAPPVAVETQRLAKTSSAKHAESAKQAEKNAIKKRVLARQAIQRRKLALRAHLARQQTQQLQQPPPADPFAQPVAQPVHRIRKR